MQSKLISIHPTTIMAGKHGFLGEILLTKDFAELRNGKILCIRFAAIVVGWLDFFRLYS